MAGEIDPCAIAKEAGSVICEACSQVLRARLVAVLTSVSQPEGR